MPIFPALDDDLKARLSEMTNHPEFRYVINMLIERKAVDRNGNRSLLPRPYLCSSLAEWI